jgi:TPR repeat protein
MSAADGGAGGPGSASAAVEMTERGTWFASVSLNFEKARELYGHAVELNHAEAMWRLGRLDEKGYGIEEPNYMRARELYEQAVKFNDAEAMRRLGVLHYHGRGAEEDKFQAWGWYLQAAERGNITAQLMLGRLYETGEVVGKDATQAKVWYARGEACEDQSVKVDALIEFGTLCYNGDGVRQNTEAAKRWLDKAVTLRSALAMMVRAEIAKQSGQSDLSRCLIYRAAERGNLDAMVVLGIMYSNEGRNTKARLWIEKAAGLGSGKALACLGDWHKDGEHGLPKNGILAKEYYERAVALDDAFGMVGLGVLHETGVGGVTQDYSRARALYEQAEKLNNAEAMYRLGVLYEKGHGVGLDLAQAKYWYSKAHEQGDDEAAEALRRMNE